MEGNWSAVVALADASRRALYDYVRRQSHPVSREEAAHAHQISRNLAAFHLDKLVDAGLLRAWYETPPGQPRGRGRAPKVYEPAGDGLAITIPQRRYTLIAEILADAVADSPADAERAALRHAQQRGKSLGERLLAARASGGAMGAARASGGAGASGGAMGAARASGGGVDVRAVLADLGFEPENAGGSVVLHNCPFHALARRQTALVCGLNHAFLTGLIDGLGITNLRARLVPRPDACCVELA
ncbi:MAG TPA: helix-turn-helix domain-containing protein [Pilimelia sp.]|nr:helix-turn-helix domain-containing protein [Pilimelia sp.]